MKMWLYIDPKTERIQRCAWQTFGCASAIASTSMLSVMLTERGGMKLDRALQIKPQDIIGRLGGLPERKIHCSVLGDKTLRSAINDYLRRTRQKTRMVDESARVIDRVLKVTDKDIEAAVLEGALTLSQVQQKTKVGLGDPACISEAEELIRFYREKYCRVSDDMVK
jgi:bacterioferritin-associated ferredoxin